MARLRFFENPVDDVLTYSEYIGMATEEPLILHYIAQKFQFSHWSEHLYYFWHMASGDKTHYECNGDFNILKEQIILELKECGFFAQANDIENCDSEVELNHTIIRQYTDETDLYRFVNFELRACHNYQLEPEPTEEFIKMHACKLSAWILQLNTAIRGESEYHGAAYRGATLTKDEIKKYEAGKLIIWAPFISASKNKSECLEGNVLFEICPEGALSEYDKRYPREISHLSVFPYEAEVVYPIACSYRINSVENHLNKTIIKLGSVDFN